MKEFRDLEALAQQHLEWTLTDVLAKQMWQYHDASLEEIFDLLEGVKEAFTLLAPSLPPHLQQSAKQEIEFFTTLYRNRLNYSLQVAKRGG